MLRGLSLRGIVSTPAARRRLPGESGYALLAVVFFAGVMLLAASVAAPALLTQGKREKEEELIWRGEQHVRAIKLFYRKNGRFPKSLEDLTKANNGIHFLRKAYKDPMNKGDGSWRFIYVGPGGQLIGSVTKTGFAGIPLPQALAAGTPPPNAPPNLSPQRRVQPNPTGDENPSPDEEGGGETVTDTNLIPLPSGPAPPKTAIPGAGTPVDGQVFGGNLIGVASKVDKPSIKFYNGYGKYKEWEFIWDPQAEAAAAVGSFIQQQGAPGTPGAPGTQLAPNPFGTQPQPPPQNPPQ